MVKLTYMNSRLNSKKIDSKNAKNIFGRGPSLQHSSMTLLKVHWEDVYVDNNGNGQTDEGDKIVSIVAVNSSTN
ncbi:hypothetical protein EAG08_12000 [Chryseobacterium sp. 3008163]|nr:hypothetical protein EAG08_12000 [Chryseobacterium sp. 3008163]